MIQQQLLPAALREPDSNMADRERRIHRYIKERKESEGMRTCFHWQTGWTEEKDETDERGGVAGKME